MGNEGPQPSGRPIRRPIRPASGALRLPLASGKFSAAVLALCLLVAAVVVLPLARRFPPWVDVEIVLAAWWVVWAVALAVLLYRGRAVSDDYRLGQARNWLDGLTGPRQLHESRGGYGRTGWPWLWWSIGLEGCLVGIGVVLALGLVVLATWLLVEVLVPTLAFLMYLLIRGMLARAINGSLSCRGHLGRATAWAIVWATAYTAPLAVVVYAAHQVHAVRPSAAVTR